MSDLQNVDPEVYEAIQNEIKRENNNILLIASENYASKAVLEAQSEFQEILAPRERFELS